MSNGREWMYARLDEKGLVSVECSRSVDSFIVFALSKLDFLDGRKIRCPCTRCQNRKFQPEDITRLHLLKNGFIPNYYIWICQWEAYPFQTSNNYESTNSSSSNMEPGNSFRQMVVDVAEVEYNTHSMEEEPNPEAKKFYDLLGAADRELFDGCRTHSQLSAVARLLNIKSEFRLPDNCYDAIVQFARELISEKNNLLSKLVKELHPNLRGDAIKSLVGEAEAWTSDPVHGGEAVKELVATMKMMEVDDYVLRQVYPIFQEANEFILMVFKL